MENFKVIERKQGGYLHKTFVDDDNKYYISDNPNYIIYHPNGNVYQQYYICGEIKDYRTLIQDLSLFQRDNGPCLIQYDMNENIVKEKFFNSKTKETINKFYKNNNLIEEQHFIVNDNNYLTFHKVDDACRIRFRPDGSFIYKEYRLYSKLIEYPLPGIVHFNKQNKPCKHFYFVGFKKFSNKKAARYFIETQILT